MIDAAIIFSDILVIPQALGMTVEMVDKKGPHFPNPLKSPTDGQYSAVLNKDINVAVQELDYVYQAITLTRNKLQGRVPLIGFCGAPWTLLCYMVEGGGTKLFIETKTWIYRYPQESKALLQRIAEVCVEYLALQVKAGAQVRVDEPKDGGRADVCGVACPSLRFMGRRALSVVLQAVLAAIPSIHCVSPPPAFEGDEP